MSMRLQGRDQQVARAQDACTLRLGWSYYGSKALHADSNISSVVFCRVTHRPPMIATQLHQLPLTVLWG